VLPQMLDHPLTSAGIERFNTGAEHVGAAR
jgi:hypothetical protein